MISNVSETIFNGYVSTIHCYSKGSITTIMNECIAHIIYHSDFNYYTIDFFKSDNPEHYIGLAVCDEYKIIEPDEEC